MKKSDICGFYFITDAGLSAAGNASDVRNAVAAGVKFVQYREKCADTKIMVTEALKLKKICRNAVFLINDRVDIALSVGADGVHLGQSDMPYELARELLPEKIIGVTVHNLKEAKRAQKAGADYLGVAPIFATTTKKDAKGPCGTELIKTIKQKCKIPVVAVGGINYENAEDVIAAGADALAAISAVVTKRDAGKEIKKFQKLFQC
ncbi:MAG: thiamine phosphate synthase [Parcubacteria group bacterium]|jgi:thiamine-phosphate pyrophosphorylase